MMVFPVDKVEVAFVDGIAALECGCSGLQS